MTDTGLRSMMRVVGGVAGGSVSTEPSDDTDPLPTRYPASTVVLATVLCVVVVVVLGGLRTLLSELTGYTTLFGGLWALSAALMLAPTAIAFLVRPARRVTALVAGAVAGAVLGTSVGLWLAGGVVEPVWAVMAGLAVGAVVLSAVFGLISRERTAAAD